MIPTRAAATALFLGLFIILAPGCCDDDDDDDVPPPQGTVLFSFHENYNFECCEVDYGTFAAPTGDTNVLVKITNFYYGDLQVEIFDDANDRVYNRIIGNCPSCITIGGDAEFFDRVQGQPGTWSITISVGQLEFTDAELDVRVEEIP